MSVTAVIPSIPPRGKLLARALHSVARQTRPVDAISVAIDTEGHGPGATRTRALAAASTEWVCYLDDDDQWLPHHIETLLRAATDTGADLAYGWFDVIDAAGARQPSWDPFLTAEWYGQPWRDKDYTQGRIIPMAYLVRTELAQEVGFRTAQQMGELWGEQWDPDRGQSGEDFDAQSRLIELGARITFVDDTTWLWSHHGKNCSGIQWTRHHAYREAV